MSDWASRSQSYRRGYVAGEQGDANFAQLIDGATDQDEAMCGYADGLAASNESDERERFEAWRISQCDESVDLRRDENGEYVDMITRIMWQAWQASQTFTEAT